MLSERLASRSRRDVPGVRRDLTVLGSTGVLVCGDVNHPAPAWDYATAGARLPAVPAGDEGDNGWQHSRTASPRGVENGVVVPWSGWRARLTASDARGRVVAEADSGGTGPFTTVVADLPTGDGPTPYARLGDWFAWLRLAAAHVAGGGGDVVADALVVRRADRVRSSGDGLRCGSARPAANSAGGASATGAGGRKASTAGTPTAITVSRTDTRWIIGRP